MQIRAEPPNHRIDSYEVEVDLVFRRRVRVAVEVTDQSGAASGASTARAAAKQIIARPGVADCLIELAPGLVTYEDKWAGESGVMPHQCREYIELGSADNAAAYRLGTPAPRVFARVNDLLRPPTPPAPPEPRTVVTGGVE